MASSNVMQLFVQGLRIQAVGVITAPPGACAQDRQDFMVLSFIGQSSLLPALSALAGSWSSLPGCSSILRAASQTVGSSSSARPCGLGNRIFSPEMDSDRMSDCLWVRDLDC